MESKGKKVSEESKKWITDVSKLHDKQQNIQDQVSTLTKEEESLRNEIGNLEKKLNEITREKSGYEG